MSEKNVDETIKEIERIRKWRKERGNLFFDAVLEASKSIKEKYGKWYEKAISELYTEVELMNELVPYDELDKLKSDLITLKSVFEANKKDLDNFVNALERGEIKSFAELNISGTDQSSMHLPRLMGDNKSVRDISVVEESFRIAKQVEEIELKVEKMSKFMTNVILLTKRLK
jgi:hypothetical protein